MPCDFTYMWNLKNKKSNTNKSEIAHEHREQTGACKGRQGYGWNKVREIREQFLIIKPVME